MYCLTQKDNWGKFDQSLEKNLKASIYQVGRTQA